MLFFSVDLQSEIRFLDTRMVFRNLIKEISRVQKFFNNLNVFRTTILCRSEAKLDKPLISGFYVFFQHQCQKCVSAGGDWTVDCVPMQFWVFANIFLFPKIFSLKLFSNLYIRFQALFSLR